MRILLAVDGSDCSLAAARFLAKRHARWTGGAELVLLHVCYALPPRVSAAVGREIADDYYDTESQRDTAAVRELLKTAGVRFRLLRRVGHPGHEIAREAAAESADLVVMGSHGRGAIGGMLLGSATQSFISGSSIPLLVVREGAQPEGSRLLLATDGSAHGLRAAQFLARHRALAPGEGAVRLLHVSPGLPGTLPETLRARAREALLGDHQSGFEAAVAEPGRLLREAGFACDPVHALGDPAAEIARSAQVDDCDLVVMGSHGQGPVAGALLGSVVQKVMAATTVPVLVVR